MDVRRSIIPSAEVFEAPRERKEDPKPGMSNVKVFSINEIETNKTNQTNCSLNLCVNITDFLLHSIWNDLRNSFGCIGHYVLPKTKGISSKTVVMSIHSNSCIDFSS